MAIYVHTPLETWLVGITPERSTSCYELVVCSRLKLSLINSCMKIKQKNFCILRVFRFAPATAATVVLCIAGRAKDIQAEQYEPILLFVRFLSASAWHCTSAESKSICYSPVDRRPRVQLLHVRARNCKLQNNSHTECPKNSRPHYNTFCSVSRQENK